MNHRRPLHLLVATAFDREWKTAVRTLGAVRVANDFLPLAEAVASGRRVAVVQLGVGPTAASRGMRTILDQFEPERVLILGVAGGLDSSLKPGDLVDAVRLVALGADSCNCTEGFHRPAKALVGDLFTVAEPICSPEEKSQAHRTHGALAVDMESHAIANVCLERGVPFSAWRAVSDPAHAPLWNMLANALRDDGTIHWPKALAVLASNPHRWPAVYRIRRDTGYALASLERAIQGLMDHWRENSIPVH